MYLAYILLKFYVDILNEKEMREEKQKKIETHSLSVPFMLLMFLQFIYKYMYKYNCNT